MRPRAILIHQRRSKGPILGAFLHPAFDLGIAVDLVPCNPLHVDSCFFALPDTESVYWAFAGVDEEILDFLVVDFEHAES